MACSNPNPNGAARWDESFLEARAGLPSDMAQCPDVFVNINYINASTKGKTKRLGYIRRTMAGCYGFNHAQQWTSLERDPSYPEVSAVPGFLEYRLDIGKVSELTLTLTLTPTPTLTQSLNLTLPLGLPLPVPVPLTLPLTLP